MNIYSKRIDTLIPTHEKGLITYMIQNTIDIINNPMKFHGVSGRDIHTLIYNERRNVMVLRTSRAYYNQYEEPIRVGYHVGVCEREIVFSFVDEDIYDVECITIEKFLPVPLGKVRVKFFKKDKQPIIPFFE